jgi:hypothetical protein
MPYFTINVLEPHLDVTEKRNIFPLKEINPRCLVPSQVFLWSLMRTQSMKVTSYQKDAQGTISGSAL